MGKRERQREKKIKKVKEAKLLRRDGVVKIQQRLLAPVGKVKLAPAPAGAAALRRTTRYDSNHSEELPPTMLVFGDGDFSFGLGLLKHRKNKSTGMVITSYDSKEETIEKYAGAAEILDKLKAAKVAVYHGVDATKPTESLRRSGYEGPLVFDRVVWNFPHTGQQKAHVNRAVVSDFLSASRDLLRPRGQAHVTIKMAPPYDRWGLDDSKSIVVQDTGMVLGDEMPFDAALFPGYRHQTTMSDANALFAKGRGTKCRTYCFVPVRSNNRPLISGAGVDKTGRSTKLSVAPSAVQHDREMAVGPTSGPPLSKGQKKRLAKKKTSRGRRKHRGLRCNGQRICKSSSQLGPSFCV